MGIAIDLKQVLSVDSISSFLRQSAKIVLKVNIHKYNVESPKIKWTCDICQHLNEENVCVECGSQNTSKPMGIECRSCTFINNPQFTNCEMCSNDLEYINESVHIPDECCILKLSFRSGGHAICLKAVQLSIAAKIWEVKNFSKSDSPKVDRKFGGVCNFSVLTDCLAAVINSIEKSNIKINSTLDVAFTDLDMLMEKASEMVLLADKLSNKLNSISDSSSPDSNNNEKKAFQKLIREIGVSQPITREMTGDIYHQVLKFLILGTC
jgi:ESCRT-II complex subunit VPS36